MTDRLTPEHIKSFLAKYKDPADARRFLQEAGLIDENGELAEPYRHDHFRYIKKKVQSPMDDLRQAKPAAQAIRQAINAVFARSPVPPTTEEVAAAVLRAAVNQVDFDPCLQAHVYYRRQLFAIAAELEGADA